MIKQNGNIIETKDKIKNFYQKNVEVKVNLSRNKFVSFVGKVTSIYPALFLIKPIGDYKGKTTFSYSEYMCGIVDIKEASE